MTRRSIALVVLLPVLVGAVALWSLSGRVDNLDRVPAAVVNLDEMVLEGDQPILAGRLLAAELTQPEGDMAFDWRLADAETAEAGLTDGTFHAVLTVPAEFSARVAGLAGDGGDAGPAEVEIRTNDSASSLMGLLADQVGEAAATALGRELTTTVVAGMLDGLTELSVQIGGAADGAAELAAGARGLAEGTAGLEAGAGELATGVAGLDDGAWQVRDGAVALDAGVRDLGGGVRGLDDGARALASGTGSLADGAASLADGASGLEAGTRGLADGLGDLAGGLAELDREVGALPDGVDGLREGTEGVALGTAGVAAGVAELSANLAEATAVCATGLLPAELCAGLEEAVQASAELAGAAEEVSGVAGAVAAGAQELADQAPALSSGVGRLAAGAAELSGGAAEVAGGAAQLSAGLDGLADGAAQTRDGAVQLSGGVSELRTGVGGLGSGASQLRDGVSGLAEGTSLLSQGAAELADGTGDLAEGSAELADGAGVLADGLAEGAQEIPSYTEAESSALASTVASPVTSRAERVNPSPGGATDPAPLVVALALWFGALATYLVLPALPARLLAGPASATRVALAGLWPALTVGFVQAVLLAAALPVLDVRVVSPVAAVGLTLLAAVTFAAVHQALVAWWGRVGWLVSLLLLAVQAASLGGLVPVETAPGLFRLLNGVLPVPVVVDGLTHLTLGGQVGSLAAVVGTLLAWVAVAVGATLLAARTRQQTDVEEIARLQGAGARGTVGR